jgi:hypothetical protein
VRLARAAISPHLRESPTENQGICDESNAGSLEFEFVPHDGMGRAHPQVRRLRNKLAA